MSFTCYTFPGENPLFCFWTLADLFLSRQSLLLYVGQAGLLDGGEVVGDGETPSVFLEEEGNVILLSVLL